MAYGLKFTCSFQDLSGLTYEFQIKEKDYTGSSSNINLGKGGFQLMYGGINKGLSNYLIGSKITANMEITNSTEKAFIGELASNEENHFLVNILRNGSQFWTGFMMSDLVSFDDAPFPFSFTITATDGIGLAKKIDYSNSVWDADGSPSEVYRTHSQLIVECFQKIGIIQEFTDSEPFMIGELPYWETNAQDIAQNKLDVVRVDTRTFVEYQTNQDTNVAFNYSSVYDVLDSICKVWNARLFQWDGKFYFIPNALYLNQSADFYPMALNTIHQAAVSVDLFEDVSSFNRFAGGGFDFEEKIREVCAKYTYNHDPLVTIGETATPCGSSFAPTRYRLIDGIDLGNFNNYNGDASLDINMDFKYNLFWFWGISDPQTPPTNYKLIMRFKVDSGEYRLINDVEEYTPANGLVLSNAEWKQNAEFTFADFTGNETSIDISDMECFGLPSDERFVYLYLDGEQVSKDYYVYDQSTSTITLSDVGGSVSLNVDSLLTVSFDYKKDYGAYHVDVTDFFEIDTDTIIPFTQTIPQSLQTFTLSLSNIPEQGVFIQSGDINTIELNGVDYDHDNDDFFLIPRSDEVGTYAAINKMHYMSTNLIGTGGIISKHFALQNITATGDYNAMPKDASLTIEACESNDNTDTTNKAEVTLKMADKGEYDSFSNLEVYAGGSGWIKSSNWSIRSFLPISHTGSLLSNVAKVMASIQENSNLRYNGTIQKKSTSTLFSPVKGLGMPILTNFNDNLLFSSGELIASEGDWRLQLLKIN